MKINTTEDFVKEYGDLVVQFYSYYKFTFNFIGTDAEGNKVSCSMGGNADEIYRDDVTVDTDYLISELFPYSGSIYDKEGNVIVDFYDY